MSQESRGHTVRLVEAVDDLVGEWPGVSRRTMFGCPSSVADGVLFAVVSDQGLSLTRLTDAGRAKLERSVAVEPFEAGGRTVGKWATVRVSPSDHDAVARALGRSYEAAVV